MAKKLTIDFTSTRAKGGAKGMAEAAGLFKKAGEEPTSYYVDPKVSRSQIAKRSYKKVFFIFSDSQRVELWISYNKTKPEQSGSIFKVKLGGAGVAEKTKATELPIKNQEDHPAAIKEIVSALVSRKKSFQIRLEKLKAPLPPKMRTPTVSRKKKLDTRLEEINTAIKEIDVEIRNTEAEIMVLKESASNSKKKQ